MGKFVFEKVGGQKKFVKYADHKAGDLLVEGTYTGRSPSKFGNDGFAFRPSDGGPTTVLNHTGQLDYLMNEHIEEGDVVQVYYKGKTAIQRGSFAGKEAWPDNSHSCIFC